MSIKPVIHVYVLCWNEEKIIPFFLRHYERFVDHIFVYDNESTDNSVNLLLKSDKVTVRSYSSDGQIRDDFYLTIKNHEWKKSRGVADIVIVCDMDEFLYAENIENFINDFYTSDSTIVKLIGYDMVTIDFDFDSEKQITELVKFGALETNFDKACMFKPKDIIDINYEPGCHQSNPTGVVKFYENSQKLLHYKHLTIGYLLTKMVNYKKRLSEYNKKYKYGHQYENNESDHIKYFNNLLIRSIKII